jgi:hypothetical protein
MREIGLQVVCKSDRLILLNTTLMRIMRFFSAVLLLSGISLQTFQIQARPYATGLTNESTSISFRLNESADGVKVISAGGTITNDLGALAAGFHTFPLSVTGPFEVHVFKVSQPGFTSPVAPNRAGVLQISTDTNLVRFNNPRGLVVNSDPASPYFGRVYVANMSVTNSPPFARPVGDGIYVLNSDLSDALGQGDTALTGGLDFTQSTSSPFRLAVGRDGNLYISDWSDATGSVYVTDPDVSAASGQNVLGGLAGGPFPVTVDRIHGSIGGLWVDGSLATGDLTVYAVDEDLQSDPATTSPTQRQSLWRHDIGSTLPGPFVMPTRVAPHANTFLMTVGNQVMDLDRSTNGNFFVSNYRSTGNEANVWMVDTNSGAVAWSSLVESRALAGSSTAPDFLRAAGGIAVSPVGDYLAVMNIETNGITIVPLTNGVPDLTNRLVFQGMGTTTAQGREVAFDAAGNLYAVSSGAGLLRVFSPGGTSTTITGSDGTFRMILPSAVSVVAEESQGYEDGPVPVIFKFSRTGSTTEDLLINVTWSGTASNGVDYTSRPETVTIPAGQSEVLLNVTPIDDAEAELTETVTVTIGISPNYQVGAGILATGTISDNEVPVVLRIQPLDTNAFERFPGDTLSFTITRLGNTNTSQFVLFNFTGSATLDTDFSRLSGDQALLIPEGVVTTNYFLAPIDDSSFEGDEVVTVTLVPNDYQVEGSGSASAPIRDDEYPTETVLFSDNFNENSSADWGVLFWSSNNIPDYTIDWAFDYSTLGIPPSPRSVGDTLGVRVAVNKTEGTPTGAAAVNLYPINETFSGDYALRFDLYLQYGTAATTEHTLVGINHSGLITNRISRSDTTTNSSRAADGIWVAIENDGSANREWAAYTSTNAGSITHLITNRTAAAMSSLITSPPYTAAGSPGNLVSSATKSWADVELSQVGNVVTLRVNQAVVYRITNTFGFNSGTIMLGHNDQFDSIGSTDTFAIFDNVRVVQLGSTTTDITGITVSGNNVLLDFEGSGQASDFRIESTPTLSPTAWAEETAATVAPTASGFRATVPVNGAMRFYRVRR